VTSTRIACRIQRRTGVEAPLDVFLGPPTVDSLAVLRLVDAVEAECDIEIDLISELPAMRSLDGMVALVSARAASAR
jgi:acyl carrier protein